MLTILPLLIACGPSFSDVQKANTIEAYEGWLAEARESDRNYMHAVMTLETLYLEKARAAKSLEGYDEYLAQYPEDSGARQREKALAERETFLFDKASLEDTAELWQQFLDEYPKARKKPKQEAKRRLLVAQYRDQLPIGEVEVKPINLAEDPEGPMNGWGIRAPITNNTDQTIISSNVEIRFLDAEGSLIDSKRWPWVAIEFPVPIEEEYKVPIKPGETRDYYYMAEPPPGERWKEDVELRLVSIRFEKKGDD